MKMLFAVTVSLLLLAQTDCVHFQPWPDKKETRETLARCSAMLSVAVDMDKVQADAVQITNEVMKADVLRLSKEAKSYCDQAARLMINSEFHTSYWNGGYTGSCSDPQEGGVTFSIVFASKSGPVIQIDKFGKIHSSAGFYDDGKLQAFRIGGPNSEGLHFFENGKIQSCVIVESITSTNEVGRSIDFNTDGDFLIRHQHFDRKPRKTN